MVIENSQISLFSQTNIISKHSESSSLELHFGEKRDENEYMQVEDSYFSMILYGRAIYDYEDNLSLEDRIKKLIIEKLLERFGHKSALPMHPNKQSNNIPQDSFINSLNPYNTQAPEKQNELKAMVWQTQEHYYQKQTVDFSASLKIQTPNQNFDMNLDLSFSKELYESRNTKIIIGDKSFIDPLVINYGEDVNPFDNISTLRFEFDLDNDGSTEMIPQLKEGAGYLALDKNDNGSIDNGSELFGPNTNNGFKELAQYDSDKNNWIDEKDAVFDKLKIWSIDENGNHSLVSLIDSNVGAIYLGEVQSGFQYQSAIDQTDALQESNGVFIKEDGSGAGVVNSIDVVV